MRWFLLIAAVLSLFNFAAADDYRSLNEKGNRAFNEGKLKEALDLYRQAEVERPETPEIFYNEGNALAETGSYEEATEKYQKALNSDNAALQAQAYYNGGNNLFKKEDYRQAIEWYQKALELNPDDMDAKYNLELARNRLREQMQKQPQDKQQQQQQQQQQQDQPKPDERDKQQQQQQQEQQQKPQDQQQQQQPQPKPDEMSKEDALRILRAIEDNENQDLKDQKRYKVQGTYRGKDW